MTGLWQRWQNYQMEVQRLKKKTNGRPIPEEKRRRCLFRLQELETRILPTLEVKLNDSEARLGLWEVD